MRNGICSSALVVVAALLILSVSGLAAPSGDPPGQSNALAEKVFLKAAPSDEGYASDRILVKPRKNASKSAVAGLHASNRAKVQRTFARLGGIQSVSIPAGADPKEFVTRYRKSPLVESADLVYRRHVLDRFPNDPRFSELWGLHNTGQTGGTDDADIDAPAYWVDYIIAQWWEGSTPHDVVVAVIDTGVDYNHPDLAANIWTNQDEIADNGIDDDSNGWVDDIHGMKSLSHGTIRSGNPMDDNDHGTHCAGTIGAVGDNGIGVTGVCWGVKIMACKFLDSQGWGYDDDAMACIEYAMANGAHIMSNSWGGGPYNGTLELAIADATSNGMLFVAAAGNNSMNTDYSGYYPAGYDLTGVISVGATDHNDVLSGFSNYGISSVDILAPGTGILSTIRNGGYDTFNGTSMATPHVAGVCAMLKATYPNDSPGQLKERLLAGAQQVPGLSGYSRSGRLSLPGAIYCNPFGPTNTLDFRLGPVALQFTRPVGAASGCTKNTYINNIGASTITWTATTTATWLDIPSGGTVPAGGTLAVPITISTAADSLPVGSYSATVTFAYSIAGEGSGTATCSVTMVVMPLIYVDKDAPGPTHDGASWNTAFTSIGQAIEAATENQEIWVAAGTYGEYDLAMKNGVKLYGGFAGTEQNQSQRNWNANLTIIDGSRSGPVVTLDSLGSTETRIDGFTIRNGGDYTSEHGAGIYCWFSSPVIANNRIVGNSTFGDGGGIALLGGCPTVVNNVIAGNTACRGGAILAAEGCAPFIANNTIVANDADAGYPTGAAIYLTMGTYATIKNCLIAHNSSGILVYTFYGAEAVLANNDVYGNEGPNYIGIPDPTGTNGNISADPLLVNYSRGKLHIQPDSPCKDAGDNNLVQPGWLDIDCQSRIQNGTVDIGADESDGTQWDSAPLVVYVKPDGNDTNDGSSWTLAKRTLYSAASKAIQAGGGEIWMKEGTYVGARSTAIPSFIHAFGGFDGTETSLSQRDPATNVTVLEGNPNPRADRKVAVMLSGFRVSTLSGFTVRNGVFALSVFGSGVISDNIITQNNSDFGGGIYIDANKPLITDNVITGNTAQLSATGGGGGIYLGSGYPEILNNTISGNVGSFGGGIYSCNAYPTISNNTFDGNWAGPSMQSKGGGIYCQYGYPTISHNTFTSCTAEMGGALACDSGTAAIANNVLYSNASGGEGAGIYCTDAIVAITNNTLAGNDGVGGTGGISCVNNSEAYIANNILYYNTSGMYADGTGLAQLRNNCLHMNNGMDYGGSLQPGVGDILTDPLFVGWGNWHLTSGSPCKDTGWNDAYCVPDLDIDGQARIYNGIVDMGVDEYHP